MADTYQRIEKKYLLDSEQFQALLPEFTAHLAQDRYGLHTICSIYYDTADFALIRASLQKPEYKEKLRLRSYGVPGPEDTVYLELKKKLSGVVYKRRAAMKLREAQSYLATGKRTGDCQVLREIDYFMGLYRPRPQVLLAYDRFALLEPQGELRVTLDTNIRWRTYMLDPSKGAWGVTQLPQGEYLMEIKAAGAMPLWLTHALCNASAYPVSYSKYGRCYADNLCVDPSGGKACA